MWKWSRSSRARLIATPWTAFYQAPPSMGFSRQEYWSRLPFPSPMHRSEKWKWSRSVVSVSSQAPGLQPTKLLRPWDFLGKSTGVGCHCWNSLINQEGNPVSNNHSLLIPPPTLPGPWQALIHLLSLWTSLLRTLHVNRVIRCVAICVWLLSLSIKFSRFTPVAAHISIFLFMGE